MIRWVGLDGLTREMRRLRDATPRQLGGAMYREGERIMTRSKSEFVPVDQGILRGSGHVRPPDYAGHSVKVVLGYGGAAAAYALIQHEALGYAHTVGQAKYLSTPVNQAANGLEGRLAADIR